MVYVLASGGLAGASLGPPDPSGGGSPKTASRSVLGHMNEMTPEAKHVIACDDGLQYADLDAVNRRPRAMRVSRS